MAADVGAPDPARRDLDGLVRDAEVGAQPPGTAQVLAARRADGERDAVGMLACRVEQDQRAVQAAGQDDADGQVGIHPGPDTVRQCVADQRGGLRLVCDGVQAGQVVAGRVGQVGVRAQIGAGRGVRPAVVAGRDLVHRHAERHQRLDLGGDVQPPGPSRPVQRLDAERVAGQVHALGHGVGDGHGELAAEPAHGLLAPAGEGGEHDGGVAAAGRAGKPRGQVPVVEQLAVVAQHVPAVGRGPRLHGGVPVDDPQPLGAGQQARSAADLQALAARRERGQHPPEHLVGAGPDGGAVPDRGAAPDRGAVRAEDERYAAHGLSRRGRGESRS